MRAMLHFGIIDAIYLYIMASLMVVLLPNFPQFPLQLWRASHAASFSSITVEYITNASLSINQVQ